MSRGGALGWGEKGDQEKQRDVKQSHKGLLTACADRAETATEEPWKSPSLFFPLEGLSFIDLGMLAFSIGKLVASHNLITMTHTSDKGMYSI